MLYLIVNVWNTFFDWLIDNQVDSDLGDDIAM